MRCVLLGCTALLTPCLALAQVPDARPQGGTVVAGQARITQTPGLTRVDQSTGRAVVEWQRFDVGAAHQVDIRQPSTSSWSLHRVTGGDPSAIAGRITSNGGVALVNPAGLAFANGAQVDVAALIATTADVANGAFMAGRMAFDGAPRPGARVENRGTVTVAEEGLAVLVGPGAANAGTIRARMGRVAVLGAEAVTVDLAGDGLLSFDVTRQVAAGALPATTGTLPLSASAASGLVEALVAPGEARLAAGSVIEARALRVEGVRATVDRGAAVRAPGGQVVVRGARHAGLHGDVAAGRVEVASGGTLALAVPVQAASLTVEAPALQVVDGPSGLGAEVAAAALAGTAGAVTLSATEAVRVQASVAKAAGGLALRT
ncbi:MAG TPA: filamentous hemagglutinin N-terminal domain-containing protein, partial [Acetobacteraceae bacterium]|nr:filamentous hemagglutinin N-terminal domain-containing protein [Acetobacteraceae bacterium]